MIYYEWFDFEKKELHKREFDTLSQGLDLENRENPVITVVGAGGKTTLIKKLAEEFAADGKKVLVTTTTYMECDGENAVLNGDSEEIERVLEEEKICFAGTGEAGKMRALPDDVFERAIEAADVVLIEGDGAKKHPIKYPAEYEPVIPRETTDIIILAGISAIDKRVGEVCDRSELAFSELGIRPDAKVSDNIIGLLLIFAYLEPLEERYPQMRIQCVINQADNEELFAAARETKHYLRARRCIITSLSE